MQSVPFIIMAYLLLIQAKGFRSGWQVATPLPHAKQTDFKVRLRVWALSFSVKPV